MFKNFLGWTNCHKLNHWLSPNLNCHCGTAGIGMVVWRAIESVKGKVSLELQGGMSVRERITIEVLSEANTNRFIRNYSRLLYCHCNRYFRKARWSQTAAGHLRERTWPRSEFRPAKASSQWPRLLKNGVRKSRAWISHNWNMFAGPHAASLRAFPALALWETLLLFCITKPIFQSSALTDLGVRAEAIKEEP